MTIAFWNMARRRTSLVIIARQIRCWSTYTHMATTDPAPFFEVFKATR